MPYSQEWLKIQWRLCAPKRFCGFAQNLGTVEPDIVQLPLAELT